MSNSTRPISPLVRQALANLPNTTRAGAELAKTHSPKQLAELAEAARGEPTLSDKLAAASRAANVTAEGGG